MGQARAVGGLYERLIERLARALSEAETARDSARDEPRELELRNLSAAEMAWIHAYLNNDLQWLRGWHAAAEELALIEQQKDGQSSGMGTADGSSSRAHEPPSMTCPPLFCALCGTPIRMRSDWSALACPLCASRVFRADNRH